MPLSKAEREAGFRPVPQPSEYTAAILRRVAAGFLLVTHVEEEGKTVTRYTYDDGTPIRDQKGHALSSRAIAQMIKHRWLIPIDGESMFDGPPQRYRSRTLADGPLPRWRHR